MATDAAGHIAVPLCWGGLLGGPGHGVASWGGVQPARYVVYLHVLIYAVILIYQVICMMYRH
jgi:hypothetical protein